jgi:hypothetical protein
MNIKQINVETVQITQLSLNLANLILNSGCLVNLFNFFEDTRLDRISQLVNKLPLPYSLKMQKAAPSNGSFSLMGPSTLNLTPCPTNSVYLKMASDFQNNSFTELNGHRQPRDRQRGPLGHGDARLDRQTRGEHVYLCADKLVIFALTKGAQTGSNNDVLLSLQTTDPVDLILHAQKKCHNNILCTLYQLVINATVKIVYCCVLKCNKENILTNLRLKCTNKNGSKEPYLILKCKLKAFKFPDIKLCQKRLIYAECPNINVCAVCPKINTVQKSRSLFLDRYRNYYLSASNYGAMCSSTKAYRAPKLKTNMLVGKSMSKIRDKNYSAKNTCHCPYTPNGWKMRMLNARIANCRLLRISSLIREKISRVVLSCAMQNIFFCSQTYVDILLEYIPTSNIIIYQTYPTKSVKYCYRRRIQPRDPMNKMAIWTKPTNMSYHIYMISAVTHYKND